MNYLLPAQTLLDLCDAQDNAAKSWCKTIDTTTLRVSVISIAEARAAVDQVSSPQARGRLEAKLTSLVAEIVADAGDPLPFDDGHASVWRVLLRDDDLRGLGATDRQVYATAMREGLQVVEPSHAHTATLQALGVHLHLI